MGWLRDAIERREAVTAHVEIRRHHCSCGWEGDRFATHKADVTLATPPLEPETFDKLVGLRAHVQALIGGNTEYRRLYLNDPDFHAAIYLAAKLAATANERSAARLRAIAAAMEGR